MKKLRTRNKILAIAAAFIALFIAYTLVVYTIKGWQWDALYRRSHTNPYFQQGGRCSVFACQERR